MTRRLSEVASRLGTRSAKTPEVIYIVDFENIPGTDIEALLRKKDVVKVVLAANHTNTVTPAALKTIEANPERVEVIIGRITRKEFVDKLVSAKLGEYAFRFPDAEIVVLANDRDYADLAGHLNDHWERSVAIRHVAPGRIPSKKRAGSKPAPVAHSKVVSKSPGKRGRRLKKDAPKQITNPDAEAVRALFAKLPASRLPKTEAALINAVRNYRESVGLRSRPSTIIKHLHECGIIDTAASPLRYSLDAAS